MTMDWTVRENVRATLRVLVKRRLAAVWVSPRKPRARPRESVQEQAPAVGQGVGSVGEREAAAFLIEIERQPKKQP
jgi:hypothetical protein